MSVFKPTLTDNFASIASRYDALLCDVWGVVHNGVAASLEACDALVRFRQQGGRVILITNAPRPGEFVMQFIDRLNVPRESYDGIVSSGDVTRALIAARSGQRIFHIGPERDLPIFDGLDARPGPLAQADYVVCSGLFDDTVETPQDYQKLLATMRERDLLMLCANPDIVVERGQHLVYCAGAIAELYAAADGKVVYAGKPHRSIYEQALAAAERARGQPLQKSRLLALGDSIRTDVMGAAAFGIDCLFVTAGIHAEELGGRDDPDPVALNNAFASAGLVPQIVMRRLQW